MDPGPSRAFPQLRRLLLDRRAIAQRGLAAGSASAHALPWIVAIGVHAGAVLAGFLGPAAPEVSAPERQGARLVVPFAAVEEARAARAAPPPTDPAPDPGLEPLPEPPRAAPDLDLLPPAEDPEPVLAFEPASERLVSVVPFVRPVDAGGFAGRRRPAAPAPPAPPEVAAAAPPGPSLPLLEAKEAAVAAEELPGRCPRPAYPPRAVDEGMSGAVVVRLAIDAGGRVTDVAVLASSGWTLLDDAARRATRLWRFAPARRGGVPVPSSKSYRFVFTRPDR